MEGITYEIQLYCDRTGIRKRRNEIARLLAEECGLPFYGKEILEEVSQKYDVSIERIQNYEETVTNSVRRSFFTLGQVHSADPSMLTKEDYIFVAEQTVICDLAANGPAVFLGHCASEALDPSKGVARVFIRCTDEAEKKKRIMTDYDIPESEVDAVRKRYDKKRANSITPTRRAAGRISRIMMWFWIPRPWVSKDVSAS